jgi:hypothetical protein
LIGSNKVKCNTKGNQEGHKYKQEPLDVVEYLDNDVNEWGDFINQLHKVEILRKEK